MGLPIAPIYSTAKHALLGLARSLKLHFEAEGCHISIVCPWFAGMVQNWFCMDCLANANNDLDTAILPAAFKVIMAGIPMVPVERVASAIFRAASDRDPKTNGAELYVRRRHKRRSKFLIMV